MVLCLFNLYTILFQGVAGGFGPDTGMQRYEIILDLQVLFAAFCVGFPLPHVSCPELAEAVFYDALYEWLLIRKRKGLCDGTALWVL